MFHFPFALLTKSSSSPLQHNLIWLHDVYMNIYDICIHCDIMHHSSMYIIYQEYTEWKHILNELMMHMLHESMKIKAKSQKKKQQNLPLKELFATLSAISLHTALPVKFSISYFLTKSGLLSISIFPCHPLHNNTTSRGPVGPKSLT